MSDKELAIDEAMPPDEYPPEEQGTRRAELLAGIEVALEEVRRGDTIPIEEVMREMEEWVHQ